MIRQLVFIAVVVMVFVSQNSFAEELGEIVVHDNLMDHGNGHLMDFQGGMVMGQNTEMLPGGCDSISEEREITVHGGHKYSEKFPGTMFSFDQQEWRFKPCTKLTVHFINEDQIRHQFMMHGLPKYIYKAGMFHLEVPGPGKISGTLILPGYDQTYLVHCDISQHMEKGMKGQVVVGKGGISMPSVPGLTPQIIPDSYDDSEMKTGRPPVPPPAQSVSLPAQASRSFLSGLMVIGLAFGLLGAPIIAKRYAGMNSQAVADDLSAGAKKITGQLAGIASQIYKVASSIRLQDITNIVEPVRNGILNLINRLKKLSS